MPHHARYDRQMVEPFWLKTSREARRGRTYPPRAPTPCHPSLPEPLMTCTRVTLATVLLLAIVASSECHIQHVTEHAVQPLLLLHVLARASFHGCCGWHLSRRDRNRLMHCYNGNPSQFPREVSNPRSHKEKSSANASPQGCTIQRPGGGADGARRLGTSHVCRDNFHTRCDECYCG